MTRFKTYLTRRVNIGRDLIHNHAAQLESRRQKFESWRDARQEVVSINHVPLFEFGAHDRRDRIYSSDFDMNWILFLEKHSKTKDNLKYKINDDQFHILIPLF